MIPSTTVEITDFMPFQTVEATDLIALNTDVTVFLIAFTTAVTLPLMASQMELMTFRIAPIILEITSEIADNTEVTVLLMLFQTEITMSLQFSQIKRKGRVIMSTAPCIMEPRSITAVCTTLQIPSQTLCKCDQRLENQVFTFSTIVPTPVQMVFQRLPNHSVIAPQFWIMAIIPAMAAATAAITAMIGRREMFSAPTDTAKAAMTGVSAVKAASRTPRIMIKFCTGPGSCWNQLLTVWITATSGGRMVLAISASFSPRGTRDCCSFRVLDSISCIGVVVASNSPCAEPFTLS